MNKKYLIWPLIISLVIGFLANPRELYAKETAKNQLNDTQNQIDNLMGERSELEEYLDELNAELSEICEVLAELEIQIDEKQAEIDATWGRIEMLVTKIEEAEEESRAQYELAKAQIKYAYEQGDNLYILLLLSSESFSDYINKNSYVEMLSEYQEEQITRYNEIYIVLSDMQTEYEKELVELEEEQLELSEYQELMDAEQEKISILIEDTSNKIAAYDDQIDAAKNKMISIEEEIETAGNNAAALEEEIEEEEQKSKEASEADKRDISDVTIASDDRYLLANLIYCEAGDEPYVGQVAVGAVVMNRIMSSSFPDTMVGVIYQKKQFSPASSGRLALALAKNSADESCYKAADAALSGVNNIGDCLYFRTPSSSVTPKYTIGGHVFY